MPKHIDSNVAIGIALLTIFVFFPRIYFLWASFWHEIGHAIAAKFLGAKEIEVEVGMNQKTGSVFTIFGIRFHFRLAHDYHGTTTYSISENDHIKLFLITAAGPLISLLFAILSGYILVEIRDNDNFAWQIAWIIHLVTHAKLFALSAIPKKFPKNESFPNGWKSDGRVLLDLLQRKPINDD